MRFPSPTFTASTRLVLLYLLLFVVSALVLGIILFFQVRSALETDARTQIANEVNLLLFEYREDGLEELLEETEERIEKNEPAQRLLYTIQNPAGRMVFDRVAPPGGTEGWHRVGDGTPRLFHFTRLDEGFILGVGKDLSILEATESALARAFAWTLGAVLVIGAAGGLVLTRRTLRQVESITHTAQAIGSGRLAQRIELRRTGDEFDRLAATLNHMFDRIEQLVSNVRGVSTGIAHDLRTPLARLRSRLEQLQASTGSAATASALEQAISEVDHILQTFAALLRLAEVEAGTLKAGFKPVDLSALVRQVVQAYAPLAEDAAIIIEPGIEAGIGMHGDVHLLQQLLANLLENALQHSGGSRMTVRLYRTAGGTALEVADNGAGIPPGEHERLLQPFVRGEGAATGSGLGLALAAAIARLHDARLTLEDNRPGLLCRVAIA